MNEKDLIDWYKEQIALERRSCGFLWTAPREVVSILKQWAEIIDKKHRGLLQETSELPS